MQAETGLICTDCPIMAGTKKKLNDFEESCKKNINIWLVLATHWFKCNENDKPHHFIQDVFTYNQCLSRETFMVTVAWLLECCVNFVILVLLYLQDSVLSSTQK